MKVGAQDDVKMGVSSRVTCGTGSISVTGAITTEASGKSFRHSLENRAEASAGRVSKSGGTDRAASWDCLKPFWVLPAADAPRNRWNNG